MIGTTRTIRVLAYPAPADLRKGYNGLYALVEQALRSDPRSGAYFLFVNRTRRSCKVLHWDGTGLCLYCKRLERGTFAKLWRDDEEPIELTHAELSLFLDGATRVRQLSAEVPKRMTLGERLGLA